LKAMEFSTLTRRVAEYSQIDPATIEANAGNKNDGAPSSLLPAGRPDRRAIRVGVRARNKGATLPAPGKGTGDRNDKAAGLKGTPVSACRRAREAARKAAG